jgi:hypothetical protein
MRKAREVKRTQLVQQQGVFNQLSPHHPPSIKVVRENRKKLLNQSYFKAKYMKNILSYIPCSRSW